MIALNTSFNYEFFGIWHKDKRCALYPEVEAHKNNYIFLAEAVHQALLYACLANDERLVLTAGIHTRDTVLNRNVNISGGEWRISA